MTTKDQLEDRGNDPKCFRLHRWYGDKADLGRFLQALGTEILNGECNMIVDHDGHTEDIDFNWGSSGP